MYAKHRVERKFEDRMAGKIDRSISTCGSFAKKTFAEMASRYAHPNESLRSTLQSALCDSSRHWSTRKAHHYFPALCSLSPAPLSYRTASPFGVALLKSPCTQLSRRELIMRRDSWSTLFHFITSPKEASFSALRF